MSQDFSQYDTRGYPMLPAREGYAEWVASYEQSVKDEMDLRLLDRLPPSSWNAAEVIDLACGTGRIGVWLANHADLGAIDGVDLTPEMLAGAAAKKVYRRLTVGDVGATGLPGAAYDLAIAVLVDEHLHSLKPIYREAARLLRPSGRFVIVGFHPQFIMSTGMPTHFHRATGEAVAIETHVHLLSDHVRAALGAGLTLTAMDEGVIDDAWIAQKPKWERFRGRPVSFLFDWRK